MGVLFVVLKIVLFWECFTEKNDLKLSNHVVCCAARGETPFFPHVRNSYVALNMFFCPAIAAEVLTAQLTSTLFLKGTADGAVALPCSRFDDCFTVRLHRE